MFTYISYWIRNGAKQVHGKKKTFEKLAHFFANLVENGLAGWEFQSTLIMAWSVVIVATLSPSQGRRAESTLGTETDGT